MFGKRVNAVIWNDNKNPARGFNKKTRFVANYIFEDGYGALEECKKAVPEPDKWAYVCFCDNWYAINSDSYYKNICVSKEGINISRYVGDSDSENEAYGLDYDLSEEIKPHNSGSKKWTDGIYQDFMRIDPECRVVMSDGTPYRAMTTIVNTIIAFGIFFFATDICIRTELYIEHVFNHYYNDRSMYRILETIEELREQEIEYYNPFSKNTAADEKDMKRQKRRREKNIDMGKIIENREMIGDNKVMDISDCFADSRAQMTRSGNRRYKRKGNVVFLY